jgi:hypothetical protein
MTLDEAAGILKRLNFQVLDSEKKNTILTYIDGKSHVGYAQADFIVKKEKKTYAVLVKSGLLADPNEPSIRRQLIEYERIFKTDSLLLLDLNNGELHEIRFEFPRSEKERILLILIGLLVALVIMGITFMLIYLRLI